MNAWETVGKVAVAMLAALLLTAIGGLVAEKISETLWAENRRLRKTIDDLKASATEEKENRGPHA